jgi:GTP diphosphokinase / guanosine-3',5'-bis(diphosphate) 3'-diphosphatase
MADRLGMGRVRIDLEELAFSYINPTEYRNLELLIKKKLGKSTRKLGKIKIEVLEELKKNKINAEVNGRIKSTYSLYKKLKKTDGNIDDIYDLMALRIIVEKQDDCYRILGMLHSLYHPMINRIKDYIATPKPNGYQSLHTTVITPTKQIVEFQIRTYEMHDFAERGLAASFHYNETKTSKDYIKKRGKTTLPSNLQWISQMQEVVARLKSNETISNDQLNIDLFKDRIFVHSPKGDIYNLPEGALPLDFAYLVHSDVAKHAYSFRVNGKMHPFDKPLKNGDVVEVITRKLSYPKSAWKELVTTSHAREKLRNQLTRLSLGNVIDGAKSVIYRPKK